MQEKNKQMSMEDKVEVTSSDSKSYSQLEKKDALNTVPNSSDRKNKMNSIHNEEDEIQMIEEYTVGKDALNTVPNSSDRKNNMNSIYNEEDEIQMIGEYTVGKDTLHIVPDSPVGEEKINSRVLNGIDEIQIVEERNLEKNAVDTPPDLSTVVECINSVVPNEENSEVQIIGERKQNAVDTPPDLSTVVECINSVVPNEENSEVQIIGERKQNAVDTPPDLSTVVECINSVVPNEENSEVQIIGERKQNKSLHIPRKHLIILIGKTIKSSCEGFVATEDIEKYVLRRFARRENKFVKKLVLNTLENNSDIFMPYIIKKENGVQSGFWTLHPGAAAYFINSDSLEVPKKQNHIDIERNSVTSVNENPLKKLSVAIKRSSSLDNLVSRKKAKMETSTMTIHSSSAVNAMMKKYDLNSEIKWEGWSSICKEQETKILKLENIIKCTNKTLTPGTSKTVWRETLTMKNKSVPTINSSPTLPLERKGIKRTVLRDSLSDCDSSDNETSNGLIHKEHNYVASKHSEGTKNLIENLLKIVQKVEKDKGCDIKSVNNRTNCRTKTKRSKKKDEQEDFLGFDYDLWNGYWRGWEKAPSRNMERMKDIIRHHEGSRDLEEVLRESELAVSKCILESERCQRLDKKKVQTQNMNDLEIAIQNYMKELLLMFGKKAEEPPISYPVLVVMAICASPEPAITVGEICHFIQQEFPFYCRKELQGLNALVELVLKFGLTYMFTHQKCRRSANPTSCWSVRPTAACGILERALDSARLKIEKRAVGGLMKKTTEDRVKSHDLLAKDAASSLMKKTMEDKVKTHDLLEKDAASGLMEKTIEDRRTSHDLVEKDAASSLKKKTMEDRMKSHDLLEKDANKFQQKMEDRRTSHDLVEKDAASSLKKKTIEDRMKSHDLLEKDSNKFQQKMIVCANLLEFSDKPSQNNEEIPSNVHQMQLNGEKCTYTKEKTTKHHVINTTLSDKEEISTSHVPVKNTENKTVKDIGKSLVISSVPVTTIHCSLPSTDFHSKSTNATTRNSSDTHFSYKNKVSAPHSMEKGTYENSITSTKSSLYKVDKSHECTVKNKESLSPRKVSGIKSSCNTPQIEIEVDDDIELIDIDSSLEVEQNSIVSNEDDEIIVIDDDIEEVHNSSSHGKEQSFSLEKKSFTTKETSKVYEETLYSFNLAQQNVHKDNIRVTPALCQDSLGKHKDMKAINKNVIPLDDGFECEGISSRSSVENVHFNSQTESANGEARYSCTKCNAIFHAQSTLSLHIAIYHDDAGMQSVIPKNVLTPEGKRLKQLSTLEGGKFYYCEKCFVCFHTEKALEVHTCTPFLRTHSSSTY